MFTIAFSFKVTVYDLKFSSFTSTPTYKQTIPLHFSSFRSILLLTKYGNVSLEVNNEKNSRRHYEVDSGTRYQDG